MQAYNTRIRTFPDAIGAKIFYGAKPKVPFEAAAGAQTAPKVDFNTTAERDAPPRRPVCWRCFALCRAGFGADLSAADRPRRRPGRICCGRSRSVDLTSKSEALEAQTGRQFVVATVNSLEGQPIEDYGYRLGRAWKIGDAEEGRRRHPARRAQRAEGLDRDRLWRRRFLTDAVSGVIIREEILPRFKKSPPTMAAGSTPAPTRSSSR